jgi:hypothetical protein
LYGVANRSQLMNKRICLALLLLSGIVNCASAHETDQFTVPPNRQFADLGDYFNRWAYRAIAQGVNVTNTQIRQAMDQNQSPGVIEELQSAPHVTMGVRTQWPWSVTQIEEFERVLRSPEMRDRYPGKIVAYGERFAGVYEHAFLPFDIRAWAHMLFFSSTIRVYGTYIGTDKFGHFTDEGINYYFEYHKWHDAGMSESESIARAVRLGSQGIMSEDGLLGLAANADYANGDISANFAGFLFYRNLTEPMRLKGHLYGPMLVRDGAFWKMADDVRPDSGFFARFISDQLDEALNPGYFDPYLRPAMHDSVRARTAIILQHYADEDGRPHDRAWFDRKLQELSTYWGIDYGHRGRYDELVSIGNSCFEGSDPNGAEHLHFPGIDRSGSALVAGDSLPNPIDSFGLWPPSAKPAGPRPERVSASVSIGASAMRRDDFGRTALHAAALTAAEGAARRLLDSGADPSAADDYGTTPLHLACRRGSVRLVRLLLGRGSDPNARSAAGTTPLHEAAFVGDAAMVRLLLESGAKPETPDARGRTPADVARAHGFDELATTLAAGAP